MGKYQWKVDQARVLEWSRTIEELEVLGKVNEGDGIVKESIYSDVNDLSTLIDEQEDELTWDFPSEVKDHDEYEHSFDVLMNPIFAKLKAFCERIFSTNV